MPTYAPTVRTVLASLTILILAATPAMLAQDAGDNTVTEQRKKAEANWKRAFPKDDPPHHETANLLLYGKVPGKDLKEVGATLEKQFAAAKKVLALEKNDMWAGKVTVYLVPERSQFGAFIRRVEKRYPEADEVGTASIRSEEPHVVAGPAKEPVDPPVDGQAAAQVGVALLKKKAGETLPDWLRTGFGRATWLQAATPAETAAERQRARRLLFQKKLRAQDAWGDLDEPDAPVLRGSVVEYMAYSGRTARFLPFLMGFRPQENKAEPTTADALKAANFTPETLNVARKKWVQAR
jgi:hypothetical protein